MVDLSTRTMESLKELESLRRAWKKKEALASLALDGVVHCVKLLRRRLSGSSGVDKGDGHEGAKTMQEAKAIVSGIAQEFFETRRVAGLGNVQVRVLAAAPKTHTPSMEHESRQQTNVENRIRHAFAPSVSCSAHLGRCHRSLPSSLHGTIVSTSTR